MTVRWGRRIKRLTYRDQSGSSQQVHQNHWAGFEWEAGNVVVSYFGFWGEVQVWASSEAEGRRVIEHACSVAAIPLEGPQVGEWAAAVAKGDRNGKPGTFLVPTSHGVALVSKRDGPSGPVML